MTLLYHIPVFNQELHCRLIIFLFTYLCLQSDNNERVWIWNYEGNQMYMDINEPIRIRVLGEKFMDVPPVEKELLLTVNTTVSSETIIKDYSKKINCYVITVIASII